MVRWPTPVLQSLLVRARPPAPHAERHVDVDRQVAPRRYRRHSCRGHCRSGRPIAIGSMQPDPRLRTKSGRTPSTTFVAERRRGIFCDSWIVRTDAPSCAQLEPPRAPVPNMAGCEISPATMPRRIAHTAYWKRFLGAYGSHRPRAKAPHRSFRTKSSAPLSDRRPHVELPTTAMSVAPTRGRNLPDSTLVRIEAQSFVQLEPPRTRAPYIPDRDFSPATLLRTPTLISYCRRYRLAYGLREPHAPTTSIALPEPMIPLSTSNFMCTTDYSLPTCASRTLLERAIIRTD